MLPFYNVSRKVYSFQTIKWKETQKYNKNMNSTAIY